MNNSTDQEKTTRDWFKCSACRQRKKKASGGRNLADRYEWKLILLKHSACLNLEIGRVQSRSASIVRPTGYHVDRITEIMRILQSYGRSVRILWPTAREEAAAGQVKQAYAHDHQRFSRQPADPVLLHLLLAISRGRTPRCSTSD